MPAISKTITALPTLLVPARGPSQRQWVKIELRGSQPREAYIGIGDEEVTALSGQRLSRGFAMYLENDTLAKPASHAIYGIVSAGTVEVLVDEGM